MAFLDEHGTADAFNESSEIDDRRPLLQLQKYGSGLDVVLRGEWSLSRPKVENFLAALGDQRIRTACDLEHGKQYRTVDGGLSPGAAAASIELDPAVLRAHDFAGVRRMLASIDTDLKLAGPARDFSRANVIEQVGAALNLPDAQYEAAFGVSKSEAAAMIDRNKKPQGVIVLDGRPGRADYARPYTLPKIAARPPVEAPAASLHQTFAETQGNRVKIERGHGAPHVLVDLSGYGDSISDMMKTQETMTQFEAAVKKAGLKLDDRRPSIQNAVYGVVVASHDDHKNLTAILRDMHREPGAAMNQSIATAVWEDTTPRILQFFSHAPTAAKLA